MAGGSTLNRPLTVPMVTDPPPGRPVSSDELPRVAEVKAPALTEFKDRTFAYRVHGDSMVGHGEDSFPENSVVIVEPELDPRPGDFVVAQVDSDGLTLRQFVADDGDRYLRPLNARYPIKPLSEVHILGVVREFSKIYR